MGHQRRPTAHQKQVRFLTIMFGAVMIAVAIGLILLLNGSLK